MMQWFSALIISAFFVVYAVVHSLLASFAVKGWARRVFGPGVDRWYRLIYNLLAIVTVLPIFHIIDRLPTEMLYVVPSPWRWLMIGGQGLALIGLVASLLQTGLLHFLGLAQLLAERPVESSTLAVRGFYGCVRHPLYTFSLLYLWLTPAMTTNLLTVFILFTLYFYIGSMHEERRLLAEFGDAYQVYQRRVPRLIPINCGSKNWVRQIVKRIVLLAFYSGRFPAINHNGRVNSADSRGAMSQKEEAGVREAFLAACTVFMSLIPQRHHRIHAQRRNVAGQQPGGNQQERDQKPPFHMDL